MRFPLPSPLALLLVPVCVSGAEPGSSAENISTVAPVLQLAGAILISAAIFLGPVAAVIIGWWLSQPAGVPAAEDPESIVSRFGSGAAAFVSSPIFSFAIIALTLFGLPLYLSTQTEVTHSSIAVTAFATVSLFAHLLLIFLIKIANEVVFLIESVLDLQTSVLMPTAPESRTTAATAR